MNEVHFQIGMTLEELEKQAILKAYGHFRNNKTITANSLGIAIRTLDNKLEKYSQEEDALREKQANDRAKQAEFLARARGNPPNNIGIPYDPNQRSASHDSLERHFSSTPAGIRMESIVNAATQPTVSMPERKEVQTMSPQSPSQGGKGKGR
jgi:Bacterial regulatory protein, Fis family